jgi:secreted trypsin-like serine protease
VKSTIHSLACAALLSMAATSAFAQAAPNPFDNVPKARAAYVAETGDAVDRVFGGKQADEGEYPFQVALLRADGLSTDPESQYTSEFCGATLIAPNWVLTAAHCMSDYGSTVSPDSFVVLTGSTDLMKGRRITAKSVHVNENYDDWTMDHDVALVELSEAADVAPVMLDFDAAPIDKAVVIGWGLTEDGEYPRHLLESDIDVVANAECNAGIKTIYSKALKEAVTNLGSQYGIAPASTARVGDELAKDIGDPLTDTMICAGVKAGGRDSCYGDSGGPLVATLNGKTIQLGIVSWGEGPADSEVKCGHEDVYGVYSRVSSFKDWIEAKTAAN